MPVVSQTTTTKNDRLWINLNPDHTRVAVIETSIVGSDERTCSMFHLMLEDNTNHYSLVRFLDDFKELDLLLYKHFPKQRIPLPKLTEDMRHQPKKRFLFKRKSNSNLIEKYLTRSIHSLIGQSSLFRDFLSAQREEDTVISKNTVRQLVKKHVAPVVRSDEVVTPPHTLNGDTSIICQQQQQQLLPSSANSHAYADLPVYQTHLAPLVDDDEESYHDDIIRCSYQTKDKHPAVSNFDLIKVLGKGASGKVILAKNQMNQKLYALKTIKKAWHITGREVEHVKKERDILATIADVRHPFLVRLHQAFQDRHNLYLVLDYHAGSDLSTLLQRYVCFPPDVCRLYGAEIMMGLQELHRHGILYRDLKPENVLLAADGHVVLTDFGLSKMFDDPDSFYHSTSTFCGTPDYMAPEIITGQAYSYPADYWSFGTMLYEMLVGVTPFAAEDPQAMFRRVLYDDLLFPSTMEIDAVELIAGLLCRNPFMRLSDVYSLRSHDYFVKHFSWKDVHAKRVVPSYVPKRNSETDLSHFDPEFLKMSMTVKLNDSSLYRKRWYPELKSAGMQQDAFRGYSYTDKQGYLDLDRYYQSEMSFSTVDYYFSDEDELKMDSAFSFEEDEHRSLPAAAEGAHQLRHTPKSNIFTTKCHHPGSDTSMDDEEEGGLTNEMVEMLYRQLEASSFAKDQTKSANDMNEDRSMALDTVTFNCNDNIRNSKIIASSIDDVSPWRS
ncbi:kinase-like domain-containing protein [Pilaira anomala]|nr:kinase-like domain-containing protein [Pilaira anomala]